MRKSCSSPLLGMAERSCASVPWRKALTPHHETVALEEKLCTDASQLRVSLETLVSSMRPTNLLPVMLGSHASARSQAPWAFAFVEVALRWQLAGASTSRLARRTFLPEGRARFRSGIPRPGLQKFGRGDWIVSIRNLFYLS